MNSGCSLSTGSGGQSLEASLDELVPPDVAVGEHLGLVAGALQDDDLLDRRARADGAVGVLLERHDLAAAIAAVGGDEHLRFAVLDPSGQRLGAESPEDDRVRRPDPAQARTAMTSSGTIGM